MRAVGPIAISLLVVAVGAALAVNFRGFTTWFAGEAVRRSPNSVFNPWASPPGPRELEGRRRDAMVLARIVGAIFAAAGLFMIYGAAGLLDG